MRDRDETRRSVVRLILAAKKNVEVERGHVLADEEITRVIESQAKMRREAIAEFTRGKRPDLVAKEQAELEVLLGYLPQQLSPAEIEAVARRIIAEVDARGPTDLGKVMPKVMAEVRGRADGRLVNQIVQGLLGGK
ncbi:MAG: GatB/YqeY domain-containing protein [Chloroflexi bacterium]|nr:GatB/YqeY domain-containing protein [Chloroflexota bacterium]